MKGLLITLVVFGGMASVGCGKKKPSEQAKINACLFDPTGRCPRQAAAIASAMGGGAGGAPAVLPYQVNQGGQNPYILSNGQPVRVASLPGVTDQQLKDQQSKIQSALQADKNNPKSMHYDPPVANVPQRDPAAVAAARSAPTQNDQVGLQNNTQSAPSQGDDGGIR